MKTEVLILCVQASRLRPLRQSFRNFRPPGNMLKRELFPMTCFQNLLTVWANIDYLKKKDTSCCQWFFFLVGQFWCKKFSRNLLNQNQNHLLFQKDLHLSHLCFDSKSQAAPFTDPFWESPFNENEKDSQLWFVCVLTAKAKLSFSFYHFWKSGFN